MAKSSGRYLTSHPQRTSLMAIDMMHRAVKAFNSDKNEFVECVTSFTKKLQKARTYTDTYSPLEPIEYKGEATSVLAAAHKLSKDNPFMLVFERTIEGTFPEDAALSRRIDESADFQRNSYSLTKEDEDRVHAKNDDEPDNSEYQNSYKLQYRRR